MIRIFPGHDGNDYGAGANGLGEAYVRALVAAGYDTVIVGELPAG